MMGKSVCCLAVCGSGMWLSWCGRRTVTSATHASASPTSSTKLGYTLNHVLQYLSFYLDLVQNVGLTRCGGASEGNVVMGEYDKAVQSDGTKRIMRGTKIR